MKRHMGDRTKVEYTLVISMCTQQFISVGGLNQSNTPCLASHASLLTCQLFMFKMIKICSEYFSQLFSFNHSQTLTPSYFEKLLKVTKNTKIHITTSYSSIEAEKM